MHSVKFHSSDGRTPVGGCNVAAGS